MSKKRVGQATPISTVAGNAVRKVEAGATAPVPAARRTVPSPARPVPSRSTPAPAGPAVKPCPASPTPVEAQYSGPLSHSGLSRFAECRKHFRLEKIDRIPVPQAEPLEMGKLAHEVIEQYLGHLVATGQQSDTEKFDSLVEEAVIRVPAGMNEGYLRDTLRRFVEGFLFEPQEGEEVLLEQKLALDAKWNSVPFDSPDAFYRGAIDLLFLNREAKRARIVDFKTGYSMARDEEQVRRYGLLAHRVWGVEEADVSFNFVRHARTTESVVLTIDDFRRTAGRIQAEARRVREEREFPAQVGPWCSGCAFAGTVHCPADLSATEPIVKPEDAVRVIGEIEKLTATLKRLKSNAGEWCALNGAVVVGKVEWGHHPKTTTKVDVPKLAALAKENNALDELFENVNLATRRSAKAFVDRYSEELRVVGGIQVKESTAFDRRRLDGDEEDGE